MSAFSVDVIHYFFAYFFINVELAAPPPLKAPRGLGLNKPLSDSVSCIGGLIKPFLIESSEPIELNL